MSLFKIKILLVFLIPLFSLYEIVGQNIKEFYIECDPDDFEYIYENYNQNIYIPVTLTFNGNTWNDLMMRIRGDSSRKYPKKSLKVVFETTPFITGTDVLNFNAEYNDLSYMHSFLCSKAFNKAGIDCVSMEHIRLYLNGDYFGLYLLVENMDEDFLFNRNINPSGNLYKAKVDGACLSLYDNVFYHWDKKFDDDPYRYDLLDIIQDLNDIPDNDFKNFLVYNFHYTEITGFIALNMLLANGSTYYHNYFLYNDKNDSQRWYFFPWDLDKTFSDYSIWFPYHRTSGFWTADNPLVERSILDEEVFTDILGKLVELNLSFFNEDYFFPIIDSLQNVLYSSVLEDTTDNIVEMETWYSKIQSDKQFINDRYSQLMNQINNWPISFRVGKFEGYFEPNESIIFNWDPSSDPNGDNITYNLYYGQDKALEDSTTFIVTGITENSYSINNLTEENKYYFKIQAFDGTTAVDGFDTYNTIFISNDIPNVVINEINYNSSSDFNPEDWVEFYNPNDYTVDLSGWYFKDEDDHHIFVFPQETHIEPEDYLILCADTGSFYSVYPYTIYAIGNMSFGLKSSGELIRLYHKTGFLVDHLIYDNEYPWPSEPDGNGPTLELINPNLDNFYGYNWNASSEFGSPGEINSTYSPDATSQYKIDTLTNLFDVFPNPFADFVIIKIKSKQNSNYFINIYSIEGLLCYSKEYSSNIPCMTPIRINTSSFQSGTYQIQLVLKNDIHQTKLVVKIPK
ncbi:MAG: CotH kinase family protein [Bacteroidales bacterium]|nr:CotH kinase family protein [Bacteroidales bacterium]